MKKVIILALTLLIFGCKSYVQVIETSSNNTQIKNELYVFENDTLKITYNFWAEKGLMAFEVYNKSNKPIYLDWKKSAYINNKIKLNYWQDEVYSKTYYQQYGSYYFLSNSNHNKIGSAISSIVKTERITFIPPKSKYYRSQFVILPKKHFKRSKKVKLVPRNDNPKKQTKIYETNIPKRKTPLVFRNFLTFSFSENFESEFYVDNEFYISKITEMDRKHFEQAKKDENDNFVFEKGNPHPVKVSKFKKGSSFYLRLPKDERVK